GSQHAIEVPERRLPLLGSKAIRGAVTKPAQELLARSEDLGPSVTDLRPLEVLRRQVQAGLSRMRQPLLIGPGGLVASSPRRPARRLGRQQPIEVPAYREGVARLLGVSGPGVVELPFAHAGA